MSQAPVGFSSPIALPPTDAPPPNKRQGLIAVNYPARTYGVGRMCTVDEAKKLCPDLVCQHVATWREGDDHWAYHEDAAANIATHKVSLDPYRLESRKIMAIVKDCLPQRLQRVEKGSSRSTFSIQDPVSEPFSAFRPVLALHRRSRPESV